VLLLATVLFINYVDRGTLPTAETLIQDDLHLSDGQLGMLLSAFFWTYAWVQIPVGWLAERYGAHRILAAGLVVWAGATMLLGAATGFLTLFALRMLLGVGESAGFPCVSKLLAAVVPVKDLGKANGVVAFGYIFGPAVGTYLGGLIMARFGWRSAFFVFGGLSLLWLIPWSRVSLPPLAMERLHPETPTFPMLLKQMGLWGTSLGLFSSNYLWYFTLSWLPAYLMKERGFSLEVMAGLASLGYGLNALSALAGGWGIDRYIRGGGSANLGYKSVMVAAHAGYVICMLCMAGGSRPVAVGAMFFYQVLCGASSPGIYAMSQILAGPRAAGRWVGIQNSIGNFAGVVAPAVTGFILQYTGHFTAALLVAAAVSLLGLIAWVGMVPRLAAIAWRASPTATPLNP